MNIFRRIGTNHLVVSVKNGLVMAVPVLMTGSIALIITTFVKSIESQNAFTEAVYSIASFMYDATFGIMALYMACFISLSYMRRYQSEDIFVYGAPMSAIACMIILSGGLKAGLEGGSFGVKGMFTAILAALLASYLYRKIFTLFRRRQLYSRGANISFHNALDSILPFAAVTLLFAIFNFAITQAAHVNSFQQFFINVTNRLFADMGRTFGSSLLFVVVSSFLWFFGIHGSDVLEHVAKGIFEPGIAVNQALEAAGSAPTEIYSKTFLDMFVLMGGCGALMSLLIAIFIFSRTKSTRGLAKTAALPMLFNVNEIMVFGLPIVLNHVFFIPFLLCPVVCLCASAAAVGLGLVPVAVNTVEWTTPILISGYMATGSVAGSLLQLFNLALGVMVYYPFVKIYDKAQAGESKRNINVLTSRMKQAEKTNEFVLLTKQDDEIGILAKILMTDLKKSMINNKLDLFYQPQYNADCDCIGAEALLRWRHNTYGMIYPPLIVRLAEEGNFLFELEKYVFERAADDSIYFTEITGHDIEISINVTPVTLQNPRYWELLEARSQRHDFEPGRFCIEITERGTISNDEKTHELLKKIHAMGYRLAIDDFAMGSTSLKYLQNNDFDLVKLDGSLVGNIQNPTNREIIGSIIYLSKSLGFSVLAEFVETREEQKQLEEIGCTLYQGYLYSQAIPKADFAAMMNQDKIEKRCSE